MDSIHFYCCSFLLFQDSNKNRFFLFLKKKNQLCSKPMTRHTHTDDGSCKSSSGMLICFSPVICLQGYIISWFYPFCLSQVYISHFYLKASHGAGWLADYTDRISGYWSYSLLSKTSNWEDFIRIPLVIHPSILVRSLTYHFGRYFNAI